jgi:hypothetical protein
MSQSGRVRQDVRFGSITEVAAPNFDFRFTPESGLNSDIAPCLKSANCGLVRRSKSDSITSSGLFLYATPCWRRGNRTVNSVKSPTSLSTVMVPPCCCVTIS